MTFEHWIGINFPGGIVKGTLTVAVNGEKIEDTEDLVFKEGDHVLVLFTPAWAEIIGYAIQALVSLAIGLVVSQIFKPKKPSALVDQPASSPVYSISGSQNAARLGEPIPAGFGSFIQVPDFGSQPYVEFSDNDQYLNEILVIGQGSYRIEDMMVGESSVSGMPPGVVEWQTFTADDHLQQMGIIEDTTGIFENVVTSPEVGDQELTAAVPYTIPPTRYWKAVGGSYNLPEGDLPNYTPPPGVPLPPDHYAWLIANTSEPLGTLRSYLAGIGGGTEVDPVIFYVWVDVQLSEYVAPPWPSLSVIPPGTIITPSPGDTAVGWFECCKPGQQGDRIMADFVFPAGLYNSNAGTGALEPKTVNIQIDYQRISDSGDPIDTIQTEFVGFSYTTNNPIRRTVHVLDVDPGRYRVRVIRNTPNAESNLTVDKVVWTGLKFKLLRAPVSQIVYGNTMLAAVRIKATNGIASAATSRIRFRVTRMLPVLGSGPLLASRNPADAFVEIMTASYGAGRPIDEIDMPALTLCRSTWAIHNGFNSVFAQRSTVFEALSSCLQPVAAGPLPVGQVMSVQVDSVKDTRVAMFNEANLTNLQIGYQFDRVGTPVGVRVEYRRPDSFDPDFVTLPENELDVDQVTLFGCTDRTTASQYARLVQNRKQKQRKTLAFDTELEGLILLPGDRISVQHHMPRWGQVAIVDAIVGLTLSLDRYLDWSVPGPYGVMLSDEENGVSGTLIVTQGASPDKIVLPSTPFPLFARGSGQEPTRVSFGTVGNIVRDWIVLDANPSSETQTHVECIIYDPTTYEGAMPHQGFDPSGGGGGATFDLIIAGRPSDPATDYDVLAGEPILPSVDVIDGGSPSDHGV